MSEKTLEERVSAIENQLKNKTLEEHFREQAELSDRRFAESFRDQGEVLDRSFAESLREQSELLDRRFAEHSRQQDESIDRRLRERFGEQSEAIDRLLVKRFEKFDEGWHAELNSTVASLAGTLEARLETKFDSRLEPIRRDLAAIKHAVNVILVRLT